MKTSKCARIIVALLIMLLMPGTVKAYADGDADKPYVTVSGSKITVHSNGQTLTGIKYMYTPEEYTYTTWKNYITVGKQDTASNTKDGYRAIKTYTDGYTFDVRQTGWYNFILSYDSGKKENFSAVQVETLSALPEAVMPDGKNVAFEGNDFTITNVRYAYVGEDEPSCSTWSEFLSLGRQYPVQNTTDGYRTIKNGFGSAHEMKYSGYYVFLIAYDGGETYVTELIDLEMIVPIVEAQNSLFRFSFGADNVTAVKWMYTPEEYTYTTWANFVKTGKKYPEENTSDGFKSTTNITIDPASDTGGVTSKPFGFGRTVPGWYNFIVTYNGDKSEVFYSIEVYSESNPPIIDYEYRENGKFRVYFNGIEVTSLKYAMTPGEGNRYNTEYNWSQFVEEAKLFPVQNGKNNYKTVKNPTDGQIISVDYEGFYTVVFSTPLGEFYDSVFVGSDATRPAFMQGSDSIVTVTYDGSSSASAVTSIKYIYTGNETVDYTTWSKFVAAGKKYPEVNGTSGYCTVKPTGDRTSIYLDTLGHYTFLITYNNDKSECYYTATVSDFSELPNVTADGSKLTLHEGSSELTSAKYMWTPDAYTYTNWNAFVAKGKENTSVNTKNGSVTVKETADGYTFEVERTGYYNFILTSGYGAYESFYSVEVTALSTKPSVSASEGAFVFDAGDFTLGTVKYVYTGDSEFTGTTWTQMKKLGLEDTIHNTTSGYRTIKNAQVGKEYAATADGWYAFVIGYDMGEVICTARISSGRVLPSVTVSGPSIVLHTGDCTLDSCKYIWTADSYTYKNWTQAVAKGKENTDINTTKGYHTKKNCYDGQTMTVTHNGYYTFVLTYTTPDGTTAEETATAYIAVGADKPTVTAGGVDSVVTVRPEGVNLSSVKYVYTGASKHTYTTDEELIAFGKTYTTQNTVSGYKKLTGNLNNLEGTTVTLEYEGWYTFVMSYDDGAVARYIQISREQALYNKPYVTIDDMDVTIYENGSNLKEVLYMYTYDEYNYTTWKDFITAGKRNTFINSSSGYRSIEATGDTSFTCFELGYYTFIMKYVDENGVTRERYETVSPRDIRVNVYLQPLGGYVSSSEWEIDEENSTLFTKKVTGTVSLPTPTVPKSSETVQFAGWYTELEYTNKVTVLSLDENSSDITLYAKWIYTATTYLSDSMYYGFGKNNPGGVAYCMCNYTTMWGLPNQIKMTCNHYGWREYYSYPGVYTTANTTQTRNGTPITQIPTTVGESIYGELMENVYITKVCNMDGDYVEVSYILYNAGNTPIQNISIGGAADVNCNGNGYVPIQYYADGNYLMMESSSHAFRIYLNEADYWIGKYNNGSSNYFSNNVFNTSSDRANSWDQRFKSSDDSAMCYNWRNFDIPAKQYVVKTIKFGVGTAATIGSSSTTVVQIDANGGKFGDATTTKTLTSTTGAIPVSDFEQPSRNGYTFVGWNSSNVGAGKTYLSTEKASNTHLYALWQKNSGAATYKLQNHSYVTAGANAEKVGSAVAKITLNYAGGLIQQGTSALDAVSTDGDFVASVTITDGYCLPVNISVKVGTKWLGEGIGYHYETNETMTRGTLVIYGATLTNNTHVYIVGSDSPMVAPEVSVEGKTIYVGESSPLPATVNKESGYTYSYQWFICGDAMGSSRRELTSAAAKTDTLSVMSNSTGTYYYQCRVTATRNVDGQTAQTTSDVVAVNIVKKPLDASVIIKSDGSVTVSSNPDNAPVYYTFYTDAECENRTDYANGATEPGGRPIKPLEGGGSYYVQAFITEGKKTLSCLTAVEEYTELPDLPFITTEGYLATLHDNGTNVKAVKYMYTADEFSYTTWKKFTVAGKLNKKINTTEGYRNISQKTDSNGDPINMDGTKVEMQAAGYYTFLITTGNGTEVAYTLIVSSADLDYHKPMLYQTTANGRLVLFDDNDSGLVSVKYMYSSTEYKYSTWKNFTVKGKENTTVNTKSGYRVINGSVTEGVSSLDGFALTLSNEGWYTFVLTYDGGSKEKYETIRVLSDRENNNNAGILLVQNGVITATTANGVPVEYIKFASNADYQPGNTLKVNSTGLYNVAIIDSEGYSYYLIADVTTLVGEPEQPEVDKLALQTKIEAANALLASYTDIASADGADPGTYVLTASKSALASAIADAQAVYNDIDATQTDVNMTVNELNTAMNNYKASAFTVIPELVTVNGSTIRIEATADDFTLKVARYNVDAAGQLKPSVWNNWTGFSSEKYKSITKFTNNRKYSFTDVPNGIYTFVIQQQETNRIGEYYDYAIVHVDDTEVGVATDVLAERLAVARGYLETYPKASSVGAGQICMSDSKWNSLSSEAARAAALVEEAEAEPSDYDAKEDIIPEIIALNKAINAGLGTIGEKAAAVSYDPLEVSVNENNEIVITRENLAYAFVEYGHYKNWTALAAAKNYKKVTAAQSGDTKTAIYDSAIYNGEYTVLAHYADGQEEIRYVTINNIVYPFSVSQDDGQISLSIDDGTTASKVGYCYGSNVRDLSNEFYLFDSGSESYTWDSMGNGVHTVYVKVGTAGYFVNIDVTTATLPSVLTNADGGTAIFAHGLDVTGIDMTSTAFSGKRSPATNTWLDLPAGDYTFKVYMNGETKTINKTIG